MTKRRQYVQSKSCLLTRLLGTPCGALPRGPASPRRSWTCPALSRAEQWNWRASLQTRAVSSQPLLWPPAPPPPSPPLPHPQQIGLRQPATRADLRAGIRVSDGRADVKARLLLIFNRLCLLFAEIIKIVLLVVCHLHRGTDLSVCTASAMPFMLSVLRRQHLTA